MTLTLGHWLWIALMLSIFLPAVYWDGVDATDAALKREGE